MLQGKGSRELPDSANSLPAQAPAKTLHSISELTGAHPTLRGTPEISSISSITQMGKPQVLRVGRELPKVTQPN